MILIVYPSVTFMHAMTTSVSGQKLCSGTRTSWRPERLQGRQCLPLCGSSEASLANQPSSKSALEPRYLLSLSVAFDHDVVHGVPPARFVKRLGPTSDQ